MHSEDPDELENLAGSNDDILNYVRYVKIESCLEDKGLSSIAAEERLLEFPFEERVRGPQQQFFSSKGINDFTIPSGKQYIREQLPNDTE